MARYFVQDTSLTAIADAIRAKTGGTDALTLDGMAEAVAGIQAGGGDDLAKAIVGRTLTTYIDDTIKSVGDYALHSCSSLTSVSLPACTSTGLYSFGNCSKLTSVNLPACTSVGKSAFYSCYGLTSVGLPACKTVGEKAFSDCSKLTSIGLPACTSVDKSAFYNCYGLTSVGLPACTSVGAYAFQRCYRLTSVVLGTESVCALSNTNAFTDCYHFTGTVNAAYNPEGLKDGYIYVPDALVDSYKTATNWSTYASQIKPLSEYVEVTA